MKDKPLVIIITLLGGAVCSICCILKRAGLLWTLLATLITLLVFMIIGLIVNKFITEVRNEVKAADEEKARIAEEERLRLAELEARRAEWEEAHPGEPFPEDFDVTVGDESGNPESEQTGPEGTETI